MTKLPEAVIEAARASSMDDSIVRGPKNRARSIIKALAENLPESAVIEAVHYYLGTPVSSVSAIDRDRMRTAIIAALKDLGGE